VRKGNGRLSIDLKGGRGDEILTGGLGYCIGSIFEEHRRRKAQRKRETASTYFQPEEQPLDQRGRKKDRRFQGIYSTRPAETVHRSESSPLV